jgi:hypothetical protein
MTIEAPWGGTMTLESGSVLRFDMGTGEVYGIATQEFIDTHDVTPMTKDMVMSYDVLVDALQASNGDISVVTEMMSIGDEVLNADGVQITSATKDTELTPDNKNSIDNTSHDDEEIE